jgi:hypothetical protein
VNGGVIKESLAKWSRLSFTFPSHDIPYKTLIAVILSTMEDFIHVNLEFNVLICKLCKSAIQTGATVESHFRRAHQVKGEVLRQIIDTCEAQPLQDVQDIDLPRDGRRPIPELPVRRGFCCRKCRYLTLSQKNIQIHWRNARHEYSKESQRYEDIYLQSWKAGRYARYWVVSLTGNTGLEVSQVARQDNTGRGEAGNKPTTQLDLRIEDWVRVLDTRDTERLRRGDREENINRDSTWVKEMKWTQHFGDRDLITISEATDWPGSKASSGTYNKAQQYKDKDSAEEQERQVLRTICNGFGREIERCRIRIGCVPKETLQKLQSIRPEQSAGVPFGQAGLDLSIHKYSIIGQRYLCFCVRAYRLGREKAFLTLGATFTDEQWSTLANVIFAAENVYTEIARRAGLLNTQDSGYQEGSNSEDDSDDNSSEEGETYGGCDAVIDTDQLDRAIFLFIVASVKVRVGGHTYGNSLLSFCAAMGIRRHPLGYEGAIIYTAVMAGLHWIARLFFLEHQFEGEPREAERIELDILDRFEAQFARWMCVGTYTVISKIINWMAYGKGHRQKAEG